MALAFDAAQYTDTHGGSSPVTASHTCSGSNRLLLAYVYCEGTITGITYNGTSMTLIDTQGFGSLYYLIAPSTGANNISVSFTGTAPEAILSSSYTGAKQSGQPDASGKGSGSGSSMAPSVTTIADNCWTLVGFIDGNNAADPTAGSGTVSRAAGHQSASRAYGLFDSNSAKTPAGSVTLNANFGGAAGYSYVIASIAPTTSVDYTLTAAQGSYTLTGQSANLLRGRLMPAAQGSYTLTGQAAALTIGKGVLAVTGFYTLSGQAATLTSTRHITAAQGSYTLTGYAATLLKGKIITVATGYYTLTGFDVTLTQNPIHTDWTLECTTPAPTWSQENTAVPGTIIDPC